MNEKWLKCMIRKMNFDEDGRRSIGARLKIDFEIVKNLRLCQRPFERRFSAVVGMTSTF